VFTGACGFATEAWHVAVLRCIASLGMGGEWALGVALVMEIWPNKSRAFLAGLIGAAANVGYLLIAVLKLGLEAFITEAQNVMLSIGMSQSMVDWFTGHQGWRMLMIFGVAPAALTFLIRIFVPESEKWTEEKNKGGTSHWATVDLLAVLVGAAGPALMVYLWATPNPLALQIGGTILGLAVAVVGYTYPVLRYLGRQSAADGTLSTVRPTLKRMALAAGLSGVPLVATWAGVQWAPAWADKLTGGQIPNASSLTQFWSAIGAILGCVLAAMMGDWFGRRMAYVMMCCAAFGSLQLFFLGNTEYGTGFLASVFLLGLCTASFYGWLPLYLPELFATRVRATGQGFGFNFGRILAAVGALQTGNLINTYFEGDYSRACSIMGAIYLLGLVLIFFAPETRGQPLPD
jgi:MFS family permease